MVDSNPVLQEKLNKAWKFFFGRGFVDGFGHISARTSDPDRILMTPHDLTQDSRPDQFVEIDLDGNQFGRSAKLPSELPIHTEVYKARPDVGAIAHFHCHYPTSFSMSEHDLKPSYFLASIFHDGIPVHPDARLIKTEERGKAMVETLGDHRAILLRAHGIVVTGPSIEEMTAGVFIMEDNAKRTQIAASMGKFDILSEDEIAEIQPELMDNPGPIWRIWTLVESEAAD
jgi:ribulose-5-phosphate 4-epimerase/fuculose-1-phosphate aldolase